MAEGWTMVWAGAVIAAASIGLAVSRRVSQRACIPLMLVIMLGSLGVSLALSFRYLATIT